MKILITGFFSFQLVFDTIEAPALGAHAADRGKLTTARTAPRLKLLSFPAFRLLLFLLVFGSPFAFAATYYVSNSGNDSANGLEPRTAWKTIERVNAQRFQPGDSILFERGGVWRAQLALSASGSAEERITFGSFGKGAAPTIKGSDVLSSWSAEAQPTHQGSRTLYRTFSTEAPGQIFWDGNRLPSAGDRAGLRPGLWWYDSRMHSIYVAITPLGHIVEASRRKFGIYGTGISYVSVKDLSVDQSNYRDMYCNGCDQLLVAGASFTRAQEVGLEIDNGHHIRVHQSTAAFNGSNGFGIYASPGIVLDHLIAHHNASLPSVNWTAGIKLNDVTVGTGSLTPDMTVQYSVSYANGIGQKEYRGAGIWGDTVGNGFQVICNLTYGNNIDGINVDATSHARVLFNTSMDNGIAGSVSGLGILVLADGVPSLVGNRVYGNMVHGNFSGGIQLKGYKGGAPNGCVDNVIQNNVSTANKGPNLSVSNGCENGKDGSGNVFTNNNFGAARRDFIEWGLGSMKSSYSDWELAAGNCGSRQCSHSVETDPRLVSPGEHSAGAPLKSNCGGDGFPPLVENRNGMLDK
jgi:hypothetical protein